MVVELHLAWRPPINTSVIVVKQMAKQHPVVVAEDQVETVVQQSRGIPMSLMTITIIQEVEVQILMSEVRFDGDTSIIKDEGK